MKLFDPDPLLVERQQILADLSQYDHALHAVEFGEDPYEDPNIPPSEWEAAEGARKRLVRIEDGATAFSSELIVTDSLDFLDEYPGRTGQHTVAIDLDFPVQVVEGGGKTLVSFDFLSPHGTLEEVENLGPLLAALSYLGIGEEFILTPRGLVFTSKHHARWVPSSTPGHGHLYIDAILWWDEYEALLQAFAWAGLVEPGYVGASMRRRATHLRLPWVRKFDNGGDLPRLF